MNVSDLMYRPASEVADHLASEQTVTPSMTVLALINALNRIASLEADLADLAREAAATADRLEKRIDRQADRIDQLAARPR